MRNLFVSVVLVVSLLGCVQTSVINEAKLPTIDNEARPQDILKGHAALDSTGKLIVGSLHDFGALNLNTQALPLTSGRFSSFTFSLMPSDVCSGRQILGQTGTAICGLTGNFSDFASSQMPRDRATVQISLTNEKSSASYALGYREIPDVTKDDDGQSGSSVVRAVRPTVTCGTGQPSVLFRILDCEAKNGITATWMGASKGNAGESTWKLVTRTASGKETWRDERTALLWSDNLGNFSWCRASGNAQTAAQDGTGSGICDPANPGALNAQNASPVSVCAEAAGRSPGLAGENWSTGVYAEGKGGMGKITSVSSPLVRWRLPTRSDWHQADMDGLRYVLPNLTASFWSTTVDSTNRDAAWYFYGVTGYTFNDFRDSSYAVRCVGR